MHRDLKPGNVMMTRAGAKLLDFGLAKPGGSPVSDGETRLATASARAPLTARGTILGTFQYMAPEQLEGRKADVRSDVWAFGCAMHEALTGKRTFDGTSQASLIGAVLNHEPPAISALQPLSPPMLDRFEGTPLNGMKGGTGPFFSADGQWLGLFAAAEGRLKKVALSGGAPVVICSASDVRGASWGRDDAIVFTGSFDSGGLQRIASGSTTPEELTKPVASRRERTHRFPDVLLNGKGVIFTIGTHDIASFSDARIAVYEFATRQTKVLIEGGSDARYCRLDIWCTAATVR